MVWEDARHDRPEAGCSFHHMYLPNMYLPTMLTILTTTSIPLLWKFLTFFLTLGMLKSNRRFAVYN